MAFRFPLFGAPAREESWIEAEQLLEMLSGPQPPLVLDVRSVEEFVGPLRPIANAMNVPVGEIGPHAAALAGRGGPIVTLCKTDVRSAAAAAHLRSLGATDVSVLRGGMIRWRQLGLPTA